jgi:glycosyltransferase involved in cell wall biosynthesis
MTVVMKQYPDASLLIVGEGQDRIAMESLSEKTGLKGPVQFTGWVDPEFVTLYLAAADVFVGPSRQAPDGWIEGQGLVFVEAMAVGTPVVATRSGGIVDSVIHEETGLLVDERSPEQVAHAIIRIVTDQGLTRKLQSQGRKLVEEKYSRKACAKRFSDLFENVISKNTIFINN